MTIQNPSTPPTPDSVPGFCSILEQVLDKVPLDMAWGMARKTQLIWYRSYHRSRVSEAQNHRCCYCGVKMNGIANHKRSVTLEHIICRSLGGLDHPMNYAAACMKCNSSRSNTPVDVFLKKFGLTFDTNLLSYEYA